MELSNYVTKKAGSYYDHTQKISLPLDSTEETLRKSHFLKGQEQEALHATLFAPPKQYRFVVIPTWRCNLRCTHCCVLHKLVKRDESKIDVDLLEAFCRRHEGTYGSSLMQVVFCGGEPLLSPKSVRAIIDMCHRLHPNPKLILTTNLTVNLTDEIMEIMELLGSITVSIDGTEETHNIQRKPLRSDWNPYERSMNNLKRLLLAGFRNKIYVQSAMATREHLPQFYYNMLKLGLNKKQIKYGIIHPTVHKPQANELHLNLWKKRNHKVGWFTPCCKYLYMHHFLVGPDNYLYTDFYVQDRLGHLSESFENLAAKYRETVIDNMPVLHDENCLSCPVIGYCWGGCSQSIEHIKKPSQFCDRDGLIKLHLEEE